MIIELIVTVELEEAEEGDESFNPESMDDLLSDMEDLAVRKNYEIYSTNWEIL